MKISVKIESTSELNYDENLIFLLILKLLIDLYSLNSVI